MDGEGNWRIVKVWGVGGVWNIMKWNSCCKVLWDKKFVNWLNAASWSVDEGVKCCLMWGRRCCGRIGW